MPLIGPGRGGCRVGDHSQHVEAAAGPWCARWPRRRWTVGAGAGSTSAVRPQYCCGVGVFASNADSPGRPRVTACNCRPRTLSQIGPRLPAGICMATIGPVRPMDESKTSGPLGSVGKAAGSPRIEGATGAGYVEPHPVWCLDSVVPARNLVPTGPCGIASDAHPSYR
jgi:hypothetical protein